MVASILLLYAPPPSNPNPIPINPNPNRRPNLSSTPASLSRRLRSSCHRSGGPSWSSNAEFTRPGRFKSHDSEGEGEDDERFRGAEKEKRRWWSDEPSDEFDDEFDLFDDNPYEQPWEKIWIFKVFKSYGYLLPAIIASMLLTTGPKAFLMAMALPLGQSALSLVIEKIWGKENEDPRRKNRAKKRDFRRPGRNYHSKEESSSSNYEKQSYRSWMSSGNGFPGKQSGHGRPGFGGWDELDKQQPGSFKGSAGRPPLVRNGTAAMGRPTGKLSRGGKYREVPLFLRLLVAVFPFLGSWFRIL